MAAVDIPTTRAVGLSSPSTFESRTIAGDVVVRSRSAPATTANSRECSANGSESVMSLASEFDVSPPVPIPHPNRSEFADTRPIQIWEGVVVELDTEHQTMMVRLNAKMGALPEHTASIALEWIHEQDKSLVKPGAVFYLTLFRTLRKGSIQNSQEIRFRRRPSWSNAQVEQIQNDAGKLAEGVVVANEVGSS